MQAHLEQVIIFCADVQRLVRFYQNCFGLTVNGKPDNTWTVLNAGPTNLALHKIGERWLPTPSEAFKVNSNLKLVFKIDTDLVEFRQNLLDKQVDLGEIKQFPGLTYLICDGRDPEGNVFQLLQDLP